MIFQLPYVPYPGSPPVGTLQDYEELRVYLHTEGLHWSYGSIKGRADASWQQETASLPPEQLVDKLRSVGFSALWVQLQGYLDGGKEVMAEYEALLGAPVLRDDAQGVAMWRL